MDPVLDLSMLIYHSLRHLLLFNMLLNEVFVAKLLLLLFFGADRHKTHVQKQHTSEGDEFRTAAELLAC